MEELLQCADCKGEFTFEEMSNHSVRQKPVYCKTCKNTQSRETYRKSREERLDTVRRYKKTDRGILNSRKHARDAYKRDRHKAIARSKLRYAVKVGRIAKLPCQVCFSDKTEAHHYLGYEQKHWYDVQWLCRKHHWDAHKFSLESKGLVTKSIGRGE